MNIFQALVYGIIQGLTEFLPVSSSAHLLLVPVFTGWADPGLAFDVALHWGTLAAVVTYFWRDIVALVKGVIGFAKGGRQPENILPFRIAVATIPAAVAGILIDDYAETVLRSPWIVVGTLSLWGVLLWIADRRGRKNVSLQSVSWGQAILIGCCQALALIPGTSRSGVTMTAALFLGLERTAAVRFSFLMAIPITAGAGIMKSGYLVANLGNPVIWTGIVASAVSGMLATHVLITYVRTRSFTPFVIYRIALAAVLAAYLLTQ